MGCCSGKEKTSVGDEQELRRRQQKSASGTASAPDKGGSIIEVKIARAKKAKLLNLESSSIRDMTEVQDLEGLKALDVNQNDIQEVVMLAQSRETLKKLNLSSNKIKSFTTESVSYTNLNTLNLSGNALTALPDLSGLSQLKELYVSRNKLKSVMSNLPPMLHTIDLSHNHVASVAPQLLCLKKLSTLNLSCNTPLRTLPSDLAGLVELKDLDLSACSIVELPPSLFTDTALLRLDISRNPLTEKDLKAMPSCDAWLKRQATAINKKIQGGAVVELIK
eukprot:TRINITY_DN34904_c0_g1_i1.p1 TRINITY_DN34904_c0_g1~~TRINITY_DN34904_c0_g1_i1.p1  ORF type:complete len:292 (+),score=42.18 TRINITY_DN34904_c0_g1_i1:45-878(+)